MSAFGTKRTWRAPLVASSFSALDGPVQPFERFACAGAFFRGLGRSARLHEFLSHGAREQTTSPILPLQE
jgi:hypothetical protein